jgi:hemerythrin-like domain-containing protein
MGMIEILRKLRIEHDNFADVLNVLERESESGLTGGSLNRDIVKDAVDYCRSFPTICHHPKEDLIYRRLRNVADPAAMDVLGDLLAEHEALSNITDELEAAVDHLFSDADEDPAKFARLARAFVEHYRQHMKTEEEQLFPLALKCFSELDWAIIGRGVATFETSYPSSAIDKRFAALSKAIVAHESVYNRLRKRETW